MIADKTAVHDTRTCHIAALIMVKTAGLQASNNKDFMIRRDLRVEK